MGDSIAVPVIAGLAIGIAFVVAFSIFFAPSLNNDSNSPIVPIQDASEINFGVSVPERDMIVKKGETIRVPVKIETLGSLEILLSLSVMPYTSDREAPDIDELTLSLDRENVVLSKEDISKGKARAGDNLEIGYGWVITNAGFLTITASPTATDGTYEYIVEARYAGHIGGNAMGSGQLITVTVTD